MARICRACQLGQHCKTIAMAACVHSLHAPHAQLQDCLPQRRVQWCCIAAVVTSRYCRCAHKVNSKNKLALQILGMGARHRPDLASQLSMFDSDGRRKYLR